MLSLGEHARQQTLHRGLVSPRAAAQEVIQGMGIH
jgi:hypothetical protein